MPTINTVGEVLDPNTPVQELLIVSCNAYPLDEDPISIMTVSEVSDDNVVNAFIRVENGGKLVPSMQQDREFMGAEVDDPNNATHEVLIER